MSADPTDPAVVTAWQAYRDEVAARLGACLPREEIRQRAQVYLDGLLSGAQRKNSWQLAAVSGDATPYGLQHLLGRSKWSAAEAGAALYDYVRDHLGDPQGAIILDETGFRKKGTHSAGVARQYSDMDGKDNCQVGVFLAYAGSRGCTLLDRELYLPRAWTDEAARLRRVGLAPDTPFADKPELARRMLMRVRAAAMPFAWVVGDTVYGQAPDLRTWLEAQGLHYVLAVPRDAGPEAGVEAASVDAVYARLRTSDWAKRSAGDDWQSRLLTAPTAAAGSRRLLFRRSGTDPADWQAYVVFAPQTCDLATMAAVADTRRHSAQAFAMARREVGLDHYEVRNAEGWNRHMTLALWALALLNAVRAANLERPPQERPGPDSLAHFKRTRGLAV